MLVLSTKSRKLRIPLKERVWDTCMWVRQGKQLVDEAAVKVKSGTGGGGAPKRVALQKEQPRARAVVRKRNVAAKSLQKVSCSRIIIDKLWWQDVNKAFSFHQPQWLTAK